MYAFFKIQNVNTVWKKLTAVYMSTRTSPTFEKNMAFSSISGSEEFPKGGHIFSRNVAMIGYISLNVAIKH